MPKMRAAIFVEPGRIVLADKPIPDPGPLDPVIRTTTTTICGTDVHILKGEYPVAKGLTVGHEPVGIIEKLGSAVKGFTEGQRVIAGAESANIRIGDAVAVFAQGPIGLCATAGAKLSGATTVIGVDGIAARLEVSRRFGADVTVNIHDGDPVGQIMAITDGRGVDVAIEALGTQATFEGALRVIRPGGTLSSLGVYSTDLRIPLGPFAAGLGDHEIITTLCPGGKERMRRLVEVIRSGRVDLKPMVTHRFKLDQIEAAYDLFGHQRDGVLKVAITP